MKQNSTKHTNPQPLIKNYLTPIPDRVPTVVPYFNIFFKILSNTTFNKVTISLGANCIVRTLFRGEEGSDESVHFIYFKFLFHSFLRTEGLRGGSKILLFCVRTY